MVGAQAPVRGLVVETQAVEWPRCRQSGRSGGEACGRGGTAGHSAVAGEPRHLG